MHTLWQRSGEITALHSSESGLCCRPQVGGLTHCMCGNLAELYQTSTTNKDTPDGFNTNKINIFFTYFFLFFASKPKRSRNDVWELLSARRLLPRVSCLWERARGRKRETWEAARAQRRVRACRFLWEQELRETCFYVCWSKFKE